MSKELQSIGKNVYEQDVVNFIDENYSEYALYVLYDRALLLEDGLKPSQRRILFNMWKNKMYPTSKFSKAQMIAGEVSGKLHPHGDAAVAETMKKLAQTYRMRLPLVDFDGNVGKFTGDNGASPRYWEARLSTYAMELLEDLKENGSEYKPTFDGEMEEPVVLPVRFPNAIINGTQGIAVGHAAKIPSHNPNEVIKACIALLRNPNLTVNEIMQYIKGPDFATGGSITTEGVEEYLETGSGSVTMYGKYRIEKLPKGKSQIVYYELPYEVSIDSIIPAMKEFMDNGKITEISSVDNFSGKNGLNLTITTKSGVNAEQLVKKLQKMTKIGLVKKFSINMTVIYKGKPTRVGILQLLEQFLDLRKDIGKRVLTSRLEKLAIQIEKNKGLIAVLKDVDKAVEIIKSADNVTKAQTGLIKEFEINEEQADYILSLALRKLTKADRAELLANVQALSDEHKKVLETLESPELFIDYLEEQLKETLKVISSPRLTTIMKTNSKKTSLDKAIMDHERRNGGTTVYLTPNGHIYKSYKTKNELDTPVVQQLKMKVKDSLLLVTEDGKTTPTPLPYLEINDFTSGELVLGEPTKLVGLIPVVEENPYTGLLLVTSKGGINIVDMTKIENKTQSLINLAKDEVLVNAIPITDQDLEKSILLLGSDGYSIVFPLEGTRSTAPGAKAIKGINSQSVVFGDLINNPKTKQQLTTLTKDEIKVTYAKEIPTRNRGAKGTLIHKASSPIIQAYMGTEGEILFTEKDSLKELPGVTDIGDSGEPISQSPHSVGKLIKDNL